MKSEWQEGKELSAAEWGKPKPFLNYFFSFYTYRWFTYHEDSREFLGINTQK